MCWACLVALLQLPNPHSWRIDKKNRFLRDTLRLPAASCCISSSCALAVASVRREKYVTETGAGMTVWLGHPPTILIGGALLTGPVGMHPGGELSGAH
jgi:hypothetical protein